MIRIERDDVILFQGDSITDAGRNREVVEPNDRTAMGMGYAFLTAGNLMANRPKDNLQIHNRGIGGDKVFQLAERWQADCLDLKPDVLSILIGVNDVAHRLVGGYDGTVETYENAYHTLLDRTRKALPKVKLVICEPFVVLTGMVNDTWFPEFDQFRAAAKRQAQISDAAFVPFQSMFDAAAKRSSPAYWSADGVHPTLAGHQLMAQTWLKTVVGGG